MEIRKLTINDLLERVDFAKSIEETNQYICNHFDIGKLEQSEPLLVGHDELNCRIITDSGSFVIKYINKKKSFNNAKNNADIIDLLFKSNIPVPEIIKDKTGNSLCEISSEFGSGFAFVTKNFEGKNFNESKPSIEDILSLSRVLAQLHSLTTTNVPEYDFWLLIHLTKEYKEKRQFLINEDKNLCDEVVEQVEKVDFSKFNKGLVHYDLHRDNAQKSIDGKSYCIFDFATIENGFPIIDLATFIGLFCLNYENSEDENRKIFNEVLNEYQSYRELNEYEISSLKTLILGILVSNIMAANYLRAIEGDNTSENYKWYELGKNNLKAFKNLKFN